MCHNHTESNTASVRLNANLTLESSVIMRAQDLYSAFPFHRPTIARSPISFLELPVNVRSYTEEIVGTSELTNHET